MKGVIRLGDPDQPWRQRGAGQFVPPGDGPRCGPGGGPLRLPDAWSRELRDRGRRPTDLERRHPGGLRRSQDQLRRDADLHAGQQRTRLTTPASVQCPLHVDLANYDRHVRHYRLPCFRPRRHSFPADSRAGQSGADDIHRRGGHPRRGLAATCGRDPRRPGACCGWRWAAWRRCWR